MVWMFIWCLDGNVYLRWAIKELSTVSNVGIFFRSSPHDLTTFLSVF